MNVLVLSGGPSPEHEVSLNTGKVIAAALDRNKYNVECLILPKAGIIFSDINLKNIDVVFVAMHGKFGEDGTIQGFLELAGIPYTGSGVLASALAMDKGKSAELFSFHGLQVPKCFSFSKNDWETGRKEIIKKIPHLTSPLEYQEGGKTPAPLVIKPQTCGSSVGISIVKKIDDLDRAIKFAFDYDKNIMVQEYISGTEVTCAILDEGNGALLALPPTQIIPKTAEFFDYEAKYTTGATEEITPPRLSAEIIKKIQDNALLAHKVLGCAGMSRTDMIIRGDDIFILETNTIPGMTETSLYPQAAKAIGLSFADLLDKIIRAAKKI